MKSLRFLPLLALLLAPLAAAAEDAAGKRWGEITVIEKKHTKVVFSDGERKLIREYYAKPGRAPKQARRGVRGKAELPVGWQKRMDKGNVIPEGVWSHRQPLPVALGRKLPKQPAGVATVYIQGKIARVVEATRVILDVFDL